MQTWQEGITLIDRKNDRNVKILKKIKCMVGNT